MNICELIESCGGPEKAKVQFLDQCADTLDYHHKRGTKITFGTDVGLTPDGPCEFGIVVWLDRDEVKASIAKESSHG